MAAGLQVFNITGDLVWDSNAVAGGVIAHVGVYGPSETATVPFPELAGRSANIVPGFGWYYQAPDSVSISTASGYPVLTVTTSTGIRRFYVIVF